MENFWIIYYIVFFIIGIGQPIGLGFITKYINESKGYDGGFAWGFFLGVIGIIVVACKPFLQDASERPYIPIKAESGKMQASQIIACPQCSATQFDNRKTCFRCGTNLK